MGQLGVMLTAFLCLAAAVVAGAAVAGRAVPHSESQPMARQSPAARRPVWAKMMLARVVLVLLALASLALGVATTTLRQAAADADARGVAFSAEVARFDQALRHSGEAAQPARDMLFRFVDRTAREVFPRSGMVTLIPSEAPSAATLRDMLRAEVEQITAQAGGAAGQDQGRALESFLAAVAGLQQVQQPSAPAWFKAVLLVWLMLSLAALGMIAGPRRAGVVALIGLAAGLSLGIYLAGEMAVPFRHALMASSAALEEALYAIAN